MNPLTLNLCYWLVNEQAALVRAPSTSIVRFAHDLSARFSATVRIAALSVGSDSVRGMAYCLRLTSNGLAPANPEADRPSPRQSG